VVVFRAAQIILPILPSLLDTFFSMLGELGVEDVRGVVAVVLGPSTLRLSACAAVLISIVWECCPHSQIVSSLEMILQRFSEELATMALPLVVKLVRVWESQTSLLLLLLLLLAFAVWSFLRAFVNPFVSCAGRNIFYVLQGQWGGGGRGRRAVPGCVLLP
jgi:hypothetical protein